MKAFKAIVKGRVQGVGFRYYTRSFAATLGIKGWVRNEVDGSVCIECEGEDAAITKFIDWLKNEGPSSARVSNCIINEIPYRDIYRTFNIEY